MKKSIILLSILTALLSSNNINATTCHANVIGSIDATSGNTILVGLQTAMATDSARYSQAMQEATLNNIKVIMQGVTNLESTMAENSQKVLLKEKNDDIELLKQQMDFELELMNQKYRNDQSIMTGLVKEEAELILNFLEEFGINKNLTPLEVIALMQSEMGEGKVINVATLYGEKVCEKEEIKEGYCSIKKVVTPHERLKTFFGNCNSEKIALVKVERQEVARASKIQEESSKTSKAVESRDPVAAFQERRIEAKKVDCTPADYLNGICYRELSEEDFQEKVAKCVIMPNSTISPAIALQPTEVCGLDLFEFSSNDIAALREDAYHYRDLEANKNQNMEEVPIVYSYKNSNQLRAAISFADNIIGTDIIANQEARLRNSPNNSEFQSRFNNRLASLNLARNSFYEAIKMRAGKDLGKAWQEGNITELDPLNPIKESYLGAGELDILLDKVDKAYQQVAVGSNPDALNNMENKNEKYWIVKNYEMMTLQNEILFRQILQNEQSELLKAAQLQSLINSPENIEYLRALRNR